VRSNARAERASSSRIDRGRTASFRNSRVRSAGSARQETRPSADIERRGIILTISSAKEARGSYMAIADTHVRSFYGSTIARSEFWNTLLRLDRVMTLDDGRGRENVDCLVGCVEEEEGGLPPAIGGGDQNQNWILSMLERALADESPDTHRKRVVGAVTIDGNHRMKKNHAYIANLAVHPGYRRRGVAERLMLEAEARAKGFGCRWAVLHVDERNVAGRRLYGKLGYRTVARQGWWEALVEGRGDGERLVLLVKLLS